MVGSRQLPPPLSTSLGSHLFRRLDSVQLLSLIVSASLEVMPLPGLQPYAPTRRWLWRTAGCNLSLTQMSASRLPPPLLEPRLVCRLVAGVVSGGLHLLYHPAGVHFF